MLIQCPHCPFSKQVPDDTLPPLPSKVTCPQCSQSFTLEAPAEEKPSTPLAEQQSESVADQESEATASTPPPPPPVDIQPVAAAGEENNEPAGFWIRVLAALLDSMLCNILVFAMVFSLSMVLEISDYGINQQIELLMGAMSIVISIFYYVFFTGYCGQTPGKMAMRVKVIHNDGFDVGYGQAFIREIIGKALSGALFCIGYLMVAMRSDKRGLHDLLARTKVIKI